MPLRCSVTTSGEIDTTSPFTSGVVRWSKAPKRISTFWPSVSWSMSRVAIFAPIVRSRWIRRGQHQYFTGTYDTADGVNGELIDAAARRRAQLKPVQLIDGSDAALPHLGNLRLAICQILRIFRPAILFQLQDLQVDLGDLAFGLRPRRQALAAIAVEFDAMAFEPVDPLHGDDLLVVELPSGIILLIDKSGGFVIRCELQRFALYLLGKLCFALFQLLAHADKRGSAGVEERHLSIYQVFAGADIDALRGDVIRGELRCADSFGLQTGASHVKLGEIAVNDGEVGLNGRAIKTQENIAGPDMSPFPRQQLRDGFTFWSIMTVPCPTTALEKDCRGRQCRRQVRRLAPRRRRYDGSTNVAIASSSALLQTFSNDLERRLLWLLGEIVATDNLGKHLVLWPEGHSLPFAHCQHQIDTR